MKRRLTCFSFVLLLTLTACGSEVSETFTSVAAGLESEGGRLCEWDGNRMDVDASCLPNHEWPLIVTSGTLVCDDPAVWIETGGKSYAINGAAQSLSQVGQLEPIWKENPAVAGARINVAPLHDLVRGKCP